MSRRGDAAFYRRQAVRNYNALREAPRREQDTLSRGITAITLLAVEAQLERIANALEARNDEAALHGGPANDQAVRGPDHAET